MYYGTSGEYVSLGPDVANQNEKEPELMFAVLVYSSGSHVRQVQNAGKFISSFNVVSAASIIDSGNQLDFLYISSPI